MSKCSGCFHEKENHLNMDGSQNCICNGSIECRCELFKEPFLEEFAQRVEEEKLIRKTINARCKYVLEKIPQTRNAGEKTFAKIYREIWYGFKIRKAGTEITTEQYYRMPHDDTINREKRRLKAENPILATYDPKVSKSQAAIYVACMELAIEA